MQAGAKGSQAAIDFVVRAGKATNEMGAAEARRFGGWVPAMARHIEQGRFGVVQRQLKNLGVGDEMQSLLMGPTVREARTALKGIIDNVDTMMPNEVMDAHERIFGAGGGGSGASASGGGASMGGGGSVGGGGGGDIPTTGGSASMPSRGGGGGGSGPVAPRYEPEMRMRQATAMFVHAQELDKNKSSVHTIA
jgi:hypothetical protein